MIFFTQRHGIFSLLQLSPYTKTKLGSFMPVQNCSYCCPDRHVTFLVSKLCWSALYKWATFTRVLSWPFTVIRFRYLKTGDTCEALKYYPLVFPFAIQSILHNCMCWSWENIFLVMAMISVINTMITNKLSRREFIWLMLPYQHPSLKGIMTKT